jgi:ribosomal protein S18 acetylase RimI-like enzyme
MVIDYQKLQLRKANTADSRFIRDLYCSSRETEVKEVDWPERQKIIFLRQQFTLQQKHFDNTYPKANKDIILYKNKVIGRFFTNVNQECNHCHLIDITIINEYCRQGIGRFLLKHWIKNTELMSAKLSLYVRDDNPAFNLYISLGFIQTKTVNGYFYLEKQA